MQTLKPKSWPRKCQQELANFSFYICHWVFYLNVALTSSHPEQKEGYSWYCWGHCLQSSGCLKCRRKSISIPVELISIPGKIQLRAHWSPVSHWWHSCSVKLPVFQIWVWGSLWRWLLLQILLYGCQTPFLPTPPTAISHDSSIARCPRYAVALLFQEWKNYTLKGYVPLFCTYWTDLADSDISFLLLTPAGRRGHMGTCTPKSFCTTAECDFFLIILWFSSLRKAVHGIPRQAWLPKAACLLSWSILSGLAILLRDELY